MKKRVVCAVGSGLAAAALCVSTAFAAEMTPIGSDGPVRPGNTVGVGDSMNVSVGAQPAAGELFKIDYPGNFQPVVINARLDGLPNFATSAAGFDVYDTENGATPVEHVTMASNQFNQDPHLMMFAYSAQKAGPVTVQFFNWSQTPLTLAVMPVELPATTLIQLGETVPGSATPVGISSVAGVSISRR